MNYLKDIDRLVDKLLAGDQRTAARLITFVENENDGYQEVMRKIYPYTGNSIILGITGAGGAGKSTLINNLISEFRAREKTVGVVLVDPTSPFSGGALLGDRIRLRQHSCDEGVFIRSIASRGKLGGLSKAAYNIVRIIEAMKFDIIIVETLGAGQDAIEINYLAQTCLLVFTPGMGDEIQILKAGIIEIADIIVLNKADLDGAKTCLVNLQKIIAMEKTEYTAWLPKIIPTVSISSQPSGVKGIDDLTESIFEHQQYLRDSNTIYQAKVSRIEHELDFILNEELKKFIIKDLKRKGLFKDYIHKIVEGQKDPYSIVDEVLDLYLKN